MNFLKAVLIGAAVMLGLKSMIASAFGPESHKYFQSDTGKPLDSVCVVASYRKASGIAVGPDGKGGERSAEQYLLKPFKYASNENFFAKVDRNKSIMVPIIPVFAIGAGYITHQVLFLRPGFLPLLMTEGYQYQTETLTFKADRTKRVDAIMDALLRRDNDSKLLFEYFVLKTGRTTGSLVIDYSAEDDALLRSCLQELRE